MIEHRNGLDEMLKGLEAARVEAIMHNRPHNHIDAAILKFQRKKEPPILEASASLVALAETESVSVLPDEPARQPGDSSSETS